jgi:hypothetical protein
MESNKEAPDKGLFLMEIHARETFKESLDTIVKIL